MNPIDVGAYDLKIALSRLQPAVARRGGSLPILGSVKLEPLGKGRLKLTASDLEVTITATIDCKARKGPAIVFPFSQLAPIVSGVRRPQKTNPDQARLTLTEDGDRIAVELGPRRLSLIPLPVSEFPKVTPGGFDRQPITVPAEAFAEVAAFASPDPGRPILTCVLVSGDRLVATDSYRLGLRSDFPKIDTDLLIPASVCRIVGRLGGNPAMTWSERNVRFTWDDHCVTVTARLFEGVFPNYRGLIPTEPAPRSLTFLDPKLTNEALRALARSASTMHPVKIACDQSGASVLKLDNGDICDAFTVPSTFEGETTTVGYNPRFLASALDGIDKPTLNIIEPSRPTVVSDDVRTRIVMPARIS